MKTTVAIVTPTLSHFEVPLYRLLARIPELDVRVYHTDSRDDEFFDRSYGEIIDWGECLRSGYPNYYVATMDGVGDIVLTSRPNVLLQYGFTSRSALSLLFRARRLGISVVHRGLLSPHRNTMQNRVVTSVWRSIRPWILRQYDGHHYGGTYGKAVLETAGVSERRTFFVPYSVDSPHFLNMADDSYQLQRARELRNKLGWSYDAPVLLFIGQHSHVKAPDVMMEVARQAQQRIRNLKLLVVGSGPLTEQLKKVAERTLIARSWHFTGYVSSKETPPLYLCSTMAIFPSRYDTWARAVNEAMLARRPCLVSKFVGAAGGLVENQKSGFVIDGLEPEKYVDCIERFLCLPRAARDKLGEAARESARVYSYEANLHNAKRSFLETLAYR